MRKNIALMFNSIASICLLGIMTLSSCSFEKDKTKELDFIDYKFDDQVHLLGNENYPSCNLDFSFLSPKDTISYSGLYEIMKISLFDSLSLQTQDINKLLQLLAEEYTSEYKELEEYLLEDTVDIATGMNWDIIIQNDVIFKSQNIVSFSNEIYTYMGGAHGNTNQYYFTYDLTHEKLITASDFFKDNTCEKLIELQKKSLENNMVEDYGELWLDGLKCDENFYVVESGLVFHYDQYEIASYAAGPIDIFLSFDDLKELTKQPELIERLEKK